MTGSPDPLERAMRRLDSAALRGKLFSGELTPQGVAVARRILTERDRAGTEAGEADPPAPVPTDGTGPAGTLAGAQPGGRPPGVPAGVPAGSLPGSPPARDAAGLGDPDLRAFLRAPFGWGWPTWIVAVLLLVPVAALFGTKARQPADQGFLYAVIVCQAVLLAGLLRTLAAIAGSSLSWGIVGKVIAIGLLLFALGGLTLCSAMAQYGWLGG